MGLLESSLLTGGGRSVTSVVLKQLQAAAPRDVQELLPHLKSRGEEYAADAVKKLRERGVAEAKAMREILETQKKHITDTAAKYDKPENQLKLGFLEDELHQLNDNRKYWAKRLAAIEVELRTEPDRIRDLYDVKATRVEPVGLVYLWPVTG
jgi:ABC-type Fe3+-citrate transport system substrate-binding protein